MPLPGTDQWSAEDVRAQIAFEQAFADANELLADLFQGPPPERRAQRALELIYAFERAAALAFATDQYEEGKRILHRLVKTALPRTEMQFVLYAIVSSLLGVGRVLFKPDRAVIETVPAMTLSIEWPIQDSTYMVALVRQLIPAVAVSGTLGESLGVILRPGFLKPQVLVALTGTPEFASVKDGLPEVPLSQEIQRLAVQTMENSYTQHLLTMRSDRYHWPAVLPQGSLIDWGLLSIWVYYLRNNFTDEGLPPQTEASVFIRLLARRFANWIVHPL